MTRPTPRLITALLAGLAGLFGAVLTRRPEVVVLAAPFWVTGLIGLFALRPPVVEVDAHLDLTRILQGERVTLRATIEAAAAGRATVLIDLPSGLVPAGGEAQTLGAEIMVGPGTLGRGGSSVEVELAAPGWGAIAPIRVEIVVTDLLGMTERRLTVASEPLRVLPTEHTLDHAISPRALRSIAGVHRSNRRGDGIEFADGRPFVSGDRARDVNWRVSARRDELWVDERHPERSGEVVIFLDSFAAVGDPIDNTLRRAVETAHALVAAHIVLNDRVGFVDLGGVLRWVRPSGGTVQLYRIVETLIETELWASGADKTVDVLPARALPRRSLVVALSPLLDPRGTRALTTLRGRGFDVALIEIDPSRFVPDAASRTGQLARRLWTIERETVRDDLRSQGIAVGEWTEGEPLDSVLRSMGLFRNAVLRAAR